MKSYERYGYWFILPFFIAFAIFWVYPVINTLLTSLTNEDFTMAEKSFIGLKNYVDELTRPAFWRALANTFIIWIPNIIAQLSIALFLAVVMTDKRMKIRGVGVFRAVFFFPNLVTIASVAILAYAILDWQRGTLNQILFGTGPEAVEQYIFWLNDPVASRSVVSIVQTWMWFGYTMILFMAGIQTVPQSLFEAAIVDGANKWTTFRRITLPLLTPVMVYVVITSFIGGLNMFDFPWVLSQGRGGAEQSLTTAVVYMYQRAFQWYQLGTGSAISYILFVMAAVFSVFYLKFTKSRNEG
ncbi:carbohydrate ABC transporter permease [Salinispira pacifica]|uniref:Sugar ABC transporter, permease protein n=1 Tax=Salinispira pacifica TaxID=1307761 RepID=V5WEE8_9SPIO|nr:sugar ABC transporter permease [Salinispira pacifica]AHC14182.1 sugar ABC transporter, permease protein [Salinispira pacifica]